VLPEFGERAGRAFRVDISGRGHHDRLQRRRQPDRDHVLGNHFAEADARIVAGGDDVDDLFVGGDLDRQTGMPPRHLLHDRSNRDRLGDPWDVQAQHAGYPAALGLQLLGRLVDGGERRPDRREESLSRLGQRDAARRAREQGRAERILDCPHGMTDRRRAHVQPRGGARKACGLGYRQHDRQMREKFAMHSCIISNNPCRLKHIIVQMSSRDSPWAR
jgi:hypothetical protein